MAAKPVQISVDLELLREIDADPETQTDGRSAFIRRAALSYLAEKRRRATDAAIRRAYEGQADAMLTEVSDVLGAQSWPAE